VNLSIRSVDQSNVSNVDFSNLSFGNDFCDHMIICDFDGEKWGDFYIEPVSNFTLHPATSVLHYGQAIFEGLKAYRGDNDKINIFRIDDNLSRLHNSAKRMAMPCPPMDEMKSAIKKWVNSDREWVPHRNQGTLYIRPFIIATGNTLRAIPSDKYRFAVIGSPVGFYYSEPIAVKLENYYKRAAPGGTGAAKAAGNYAAAFAPTLQAKTQGFDQLLWTDTSEKQYIEELGSANFFLFTKESKILTPPLSNSILAGITRDTIIQIAKELKIEVVEKLISKGEIIEMLENGEILSLFASGTAAAITYINRINIDDEDYKLQSNQEVQIQNIKKRLDAIRFGDEEESYGWCNWI